MRPTAHGQIGNHDTLVSTPLEPAKIEAYSKIYDFRRRQPMCHALRYIGL